MVRNTEGEGLPHYYQFLTAVHRLPKPPSEKMEHRTIVTSHRCSILCSLFSLDYGEVVRNTDGGGATPLLPNFSQLLLTVYQKPQEGRKCHRCSYVSTHKLDNREVVRNLNGILHRRAGPPDYYQISHNCCSPFSKKTKVRQWNTVYTCESQLFLCCHSAVWLTVWLWRNCMKYNGELQRGAGRGDPTITKQTK